MKVFLTGGNGMLGRVLSRIAAAEYPEITLFTPSRSELPLTDANAVREYYAGHDFDAVIHGAAQVGGIAANIKDPIGYLVENLRMNDAVVMGAYEAKVPNLVYLGSSCMYPKDYRQPLVESDILAAPLEPTNEGYALAKITGAKLCEYISRTSPLNYKTLLPCNLFGCEDHFGSVSSHLIAAVVTKMVDAVKNNDDVVTIWGSGKARREFLFVDDLARFILANLKRLNEFPPYMNLGYGEDFSIDEYYRMVGEIVGYSGQYEYDLSKPEGMMRKLVDSSLANTHGWQVQTQIHEALVQTVKTYQTLAVDTI